MPPETSFSGVLLSMLAVLGCLAALPWLLKRLRLQHQTRATSMRVIETLSLGPRERLIVVQAGDQRMLLGVAAQGVQLITTLEPASEDAPDSDIPAPSPFAQVLAQWRSRSQGTP